AVVGTRRRLGMEVIPLGRSAVRSIIAALAANRVVALLCDLEQGPGVQVRFFGRRAIVPGGPAAFAMKTGAALVPTFVYGVGGGKYHGYVHEPLTWSPSDTKESLTQRVIDRFEQFIKERPDQWYAFRPMFSYLWRYRLSRAFTALQYRAFKAIQSIVQHLPRPWAYAL